MKNKKMFVAALAAVGAISMCSSAIAQGATAQGTMPMYTTDANRLSVGDQIFIMDLMHANALEIELSRIAVHQASSKGVSDYAMMMVNDHTALQNQLTTSYGSQAWMTSWNKDMRHHMMTNNLSSGSMDNGMSNMDNGNMSGGQMAGGGTMDNMMGNWMYLDGSDWDKIHHLKGLNGYEFDKAYVMMSVSYHRMLLDKIWKENNTTDNSDAKTLAGNVQQTVEHHLAEGRRISYNYDDLFGIHRSSPW